MKGKDFNGPLLVHKLDHGFAASVSGCLAAVSSCSPCFPSFCSPSSQSMIQMTLCDAWSSNSTSPWSLWNPMPPKWKRWACSFVVIGICFVMLYSALEMRLWDTPNTPNTCSCSRLFFVCTNVLTCIAGEHFFVLLWSLKLCLLVIWAKELEPVHSTADELEVPGCKPLSRVLRYNRLYYVNVDWLVWHPTGCKEARFNEKKWFEPHQPDCQNTIPSRTVVVVRDEFWDAERLLLCVAMGKRRNPNNRRFFGCHSLQLLLDVAVPVCRVQECQGTGNHLSFHILAILHLRVSQCMNFPSRISHRMRFSSMLHTMWCQTIRIGFELVRVKHSFDQKPCSFDVSLIFRRYMHDLCENGCPLVGYICYFPLDILLYFGVNLRASVKAVLGTGFQAGLFAGCNRRVKRYYFICLVSFVSEPPIISRY